MPQLHRSRTLAFQRQHGRCIYCHHPMWTDNPAGFAAEQGLRLRTVWRFQCTAEHLIARQDGGGDGPDNIAAACAFCNRQRHHRKRPLAPVPYGAYVLARMHRSRWHPCAGAGHSGP